MNRFLSFITSFSVGCLIARCITLLLRKNVKRIADLEARILLQGRKNSDSCSLHVLKKESCSKECRYEFLKWLLSCIDEAKSHLDVCMYFLSDIDVAHALIKAKERGIQVRVIISGEFKISGIQMGEEVVKMRRVHIPFRIMETPASQLMHVKMIMVDREYVIFGSMNLTMSAVQSNSEEMTKLWDPAIVTDLSRYFQGVWDDMTEHTEFLMRIGDLVEKRLKENAKSKAQAAPLEDMGKW